MNPKIKNKIVLLLFIANLILNFSYYCKTDPKTRTHDNGDGGHFSYIEHIAINKTFPRTKDGWVFYHPPFYYLVQSFIYNYLSLPIEKNNSANLEKIIQLTSLLYFSLFQLFGIKIINLSFKKKDFFYFLTITLFLFWPSGVIHSSRIGNDIFLYLFSAISLYFCLKWTNRKLMKDFLSSLLFAILASLSKTNGIILIFLLGCLLLKNFSFLKNKFKYFSAISFGILIIVLNLIYKNKIDTGSWSLNSNLIGNTNNLSNALIVDNNPSHLLFFNITKYLKIPYINPWTDDSGRQYFFNYLLKTSLHGEFYFDKKVQKILISLISLFYLNMIIAIIPGLIFHKIEENKIQSTLVFYLVILLLSIFLARIKYPFSCTNDFRYIFPAIIPFSVLLNLSLKSLTNKYPLLVKIIVTSEIGFIISSILFWFFL